MCGIAGIHTPGEPVDHALLQRMVGAMLHRGPDGHGVFIDGDIGLGMRRLAIVDIDGGKQPYSNESGSLHVVFNGEIYNHRALRDELEAGGHSMASMADGEVIAHVYEEHGPVGLDRLDGIFAFALWDADRRRLVLARDRLGVKPLYLHRSAAGIRFASELNALLRDPAVPRRLDLAALDAHLALRFTPSPMTLLEEVEKLEPATLLVLEEGEAARIRYWDPAPRERTDLSLDEAAQGFRDGLRAAVRRQMMSDRPIGAMLSGGLDSAAIVALMAEQSSDVRTFTVGFEGMADANETALARETASLFATQHSDVVLPAGGFKADLPAAIAMLEEPVATSSAIGFREVARLARPHVPVLLSGQGADELLGGYWRYVGEWISARASGAVRALHLDPTLSAVAKRTRAARLQRGIDAVRHPDTLERFISTYAVFGEDQKARLYQPEVLASIASRGRLTVEAAIEGHRRRAADRDSLGQMMFVDLRLWLPDDLLLVGDKMAMAESVEMRVPFLDRELVEFVESLPTGFKVRGFARKVVEKRALQGLLPRQIVHRKERGFVTPMSRWLRGPEVGDYARDLLLDPEGICAELMDREYLGALLDRHRTRKADHTRQLFCLLSFEIWGRQFLRGQATESTIGAGRSTST